MKSQFLLSFKIIFKFKFPDKPLQITNNYVSWEQKIYLNKKNNIDSI